MVVSSDRSARRTAELGHYADGPFLLVECCNFFVTHHYQRETVRKDAAGSHVVKTTAFCLADSRINIESYVQDCIDFAIKEACERQDIVSTFFRIACSYRNVNF